MTYDTKVPQQLKKIQQWFGSIISRPIDDNSQMIPLSPSNKPMEEEAAIYIAPSPTLHPAQRIQLYNQQYWWRLLNAFQESYPLVTRLFGYYDFNKTIVIPYLVKYPPRHWSLSLLGDRLTYWIEKEYHADDKVLVLNAAKIDWAFNYSFIASQLSPITANDLSEGKNAANLLKRKLYLQPSLHFFEMNYDLFQFRIEFLKQEPNYWIENDFPELVHDKTRFFYLYRTQKNDISWNEISQGEYHLLQLFRKGATIEKACSWLESQEASLYNAAIKNLHLWFQEWTIRGWLSLENPNKP